MCPYLFLREEEEGQYDHNHPEAGFKQHGAQEEKEQGDGGRDEEGDGNDHEDHSTELGGATQGSEPSRGVSPVAAVTRVHVAKELHSV